MAKLRVLPVLRTGGFLHPADRKALTALRSLPWAQSGLEYISSHALERAAIASLLANAVRAGPGTYAHLQAMLAEICAALDAECPALFVEEIASPAFRTLGCRQTAIVVSRGAVEMLEDDEMQAALAHEACHLTCGHLPYLMLCECGRIFLRAGAPLSLPFLPAQLALEEWRCRAAFSCDRGALLLLGDLGAVERMIAKQCGAGRRAEIATQAWVKQQEDFLRLSADFLGKWTARAFIHGNAQNTLAALRVAEIEAWAKSAAHEAIAAGRATADEHGDGSRLWGEFAPQVAAAGDWEEAAKTWGATWGEMWRRFADTSAAAAPGIAAALGNAAAAFLRGLQDGLRTRDK